MNVLMKLGLRRMILFVVIFQVILIHFYFLSSSAHQGPIPLDIRLKQIRSYMNSTVTILYEDRLIDPHIPSTCKTYYHPGNSWQTNKALTINNYGV